VLGLACGDAMGATLQFRKPGQFTKVADLVGGGPWQLPRGAWTDETAMSLCLAESLLAIDGFDAADQRRRYRRWQLAGELTSTGACLGITAGVAALLQGGEGGPEPALIPNAVSDAQAITRTGVVALFAVSAPGRVLDWAAAAAAVTDRAPALRVAARYFAALLLAALRGTPRERLPSEAREILRAHGQGSESLDFERWYADGQPLQSAGAPPAAGPLALLHDVLATLLATPGFREGLLQVVNLGGDSDIRGALFGQLAGALYGVHGIPAPWNRGLLRRGLLEDVADRLLVAGLAPRD